MVICFLFSVFTDSMWSLWRRRHVSGRTNGCISEVFKDWCWTYRDHVSEPVFTADRPMKSVAVEDQPFGYTSRGEPIAATRRPSGNLRGWLQGVITGRRLGPFAPARTQYWPYAADGCRSGRWVRNGLRSTAASLSSSPRLIVCRTPTLSPRYPRSPPRSYRSQSVCRSRVRSRLHVRSQYPDPT